MKFTDRDIDILKGFYEDGDTFTKALPSLERAADESRYRFVQFEECGYRGKSTYKEITRAQAICAIGRNWWLNGLVHAADHKITRRDAGDGYSFVLFISPDTFSKI